MNRSLTIKNLVGLWLLLLTQPYVGKSQNGGFVCNGDLIVEQNGFFHKLLLDDEEGDFELQPLFNTERIIEAIAYRQKDNYIYGIDYSASPYTRLIRISQNGVVEVLDSLFNDQKIFYDFHAGAISNDQQYFFLLEYPEENYLNPGMLPNRLFMVDLEDPEYSFSSVAINWSGNPISVFVGDIGIDPSTGIVYSYDHISKKIITIDPQTGLVDNQTFPSTFIPGVEFFVGALFFDVSSRLIGQGRMVGGHVALQIDKSTGKISKYYLRNDSPASITFQDGCSCPFTIRLEQEVLPEKAYPCTEIRYTTRIYNLSKTEQNNLVFRDSFPEGFEILEIVKNPYGGEVTGVGTNRLNISNISAPYGIDSIMVRVYVPEFAPPGVHYAHASLSGVDLRAGNDDRTRIWSDYPASVKIDDPTPIEVLTPNQSEFRTEFELCAETPLVLQPADDATGLRFLWENGSQDSTQTVNNPGEYKVTVSTGCEDIALTIRVENTNLSVNLGPDIELGPGKTVQLFPKVESGSPITQFTWTAADTTALSCVNCPEVGVSPKDDILVHVEIENESGCQAGDVVLIKVDRKVFTPTVFSPNNDGINDRFYFQTEENAGIVRMQIFDRWGGMVFEKKGGATNVPGDGWDGSARGKLLPTGVYVWLAELEYEGGYTIQLSGNVLLVK